MQFLLTRATISYTFIVASAKGVIKDALMTKQWHKLRCQAKYGEVRDEILAFFNIARAQFVTNSVVQPTNPQSAVNPQIPPSPPPPLPPPLLA
jgi:hypothetical protein